MRTIAEIATTEMGYEGVQFRFTGSIDGGRGWKGDVKNMLLDVSKLKSLGWGSGCNSAEAVAKAAHEIINYLGVQRA